MHVPATTNPHRSSPAETGCTEQRSDPTDTYVNVPPMSNQQNTSGPDLVCLENLPVPRCSLERR